MMDLDWVGGFHDWVAKYSNEQASQLKVKMQQNRKKKF